MAIGDFSIRDAVLKNYLHFLKFYMNFCFFLQISSNTASFSLFFKINIGFVLKYILGPSPQTDWYYFVNYNLNRSGKRDDKKFMNRIKRKIIKKLK